MPALLDTILARRTIRQYEPQPIPAVDLEHIIACAQRAPTGGGLQMYTFIRVTDAALRAQIAHVAGDQVHITTAPEFFIVCADVHRAQAMLLQRDIQPAQAPGMFLLYGMTDAMLAVGYMAVAAEALGYGVCFIGGIQNALDEIACLLALPPGVLPLVGLCIGRPAEQPPVRPRLPAAIIVRENSYGALSPADVASCYQAMAAATRQGDWLPTLKRYLGVGGTLDTRQTILQRAKDQQGF
jgi:nitroreductase